jgi:hypothetical protein
MYCLEGIQGQLYNTLYSCKYDEAQKEGVP